MKIEIKNVVSSITWDFEKKEDFENTKNDIYECLRTPNTRIVHNSNGKEVIITHAYLNKSLIILTK